MAESKVWTVQEVLELQKNNPTEYQKHRLEILGQDLQGKIK
jgi:hypothetical protein